MRRIARDQPAQIGGLGIFHHEIRRQVAVKRGNRLAGCPQFAVDALGVLQRGLHRVMPP